MKDNYDGRVCYHCHEKGHIANKCPQKDEKSALRSQSVCFICGGKGHIARNCRHRFDKRSWEGQSGKAASFQSADDNKEDEKVSCQGCACCTKRKSCACDGTSESASSFKDIAEVDVGFRDQKIELEDGHVHKVCHLVCKCPIPVCSCVKLPTSKGLVNGFSATTMRDSGCSGIVVRAEYVHSKQYIGKNKLCLMIDGTARNVPLARVNIDCPFFRGEAEVMVIPLPIYDLIIGNVPGAREPNDPDKTWTPAPQCEEGHAVVTRQQSLEQHKKTTKPLSVPKPSDIQPTKMKDLAKEQEEDPTLQKVFQKARSKEPRKQPKHQ